MRLDKFLVEKGFFNSRARAKEAIVSGSVLVDGHIVKDSDADTPETAHIEASEPFPWVSRGALKLIGALDEWNISPKGKYVLDLGASTGGFTQVLLSQGAKHVYAVDVGHGQLHPSLQKDPKVTSLEGRDARTLRLKDFPSAFPLIVGDLSFISLQKIFPVVYALLEKGGEAVFLVKPQFEAERGKTKKGIVRDDAVREETLQNTLASAKKAGFSVLGSMPSPILGGSGNTEYLIWLKKTA